MDERARAIEELYRSRYAALWNTISALLGDREAAHEVVQETFARALAKRRQLRDPGALEPWLWRIALRTARERFGQQSLPLEEAFEPALPAPERDLDLDAALRALPPKRRLVVFLRYFAGLSYAEIAEAAEIAEGTVAATLSQAREQLLRQLQPDFDPEEVKR